MNQTARLVKSGFGAVCLIANLIGITFPFQGYSQTPNPWEQLKVSYPDQQAVFLSYERTVTLFIKDDSLRATEEIEEDIFILKDIGDMFSPREIHGSHFAEVSQIKARTLVWDKGRYREMPVTDIVRKKELDNEIFYDDSYYYSVSFPGVAPDNRTVLTYQNYYRDVRFLPPFYFTRYFPYQKIKLTVKAPKGVELRFLTLNDSLKKINYRTYEKGPYLYHEWEAAQMQGMVSRRSAPAPAYTAPQVIVYVNSFMLGNQRKPVLRDINDLYQWYRSFVASLSTDYSAELRAEVNKLISPSDSELQKVQKIFFWVQQNIKYIAFEDGMRGFIPHSSSYVFAKRYGDCKDMTSLLVGMLDVAGVKAYYTWIGTRDLPYRYSQLPTPLVDNHMIATYLAPDGKPIFLDGTSRHTRFGLPSSMIQGKEALIGLGPDTYRLATVPVEEPVTSLMTDSVKMVVADGELMGKGKISLEGYAKVFGGYELDRSQKEAEKQYVTKLAGKGSNKFFLDNYLIEDLHNLDKPTRVFYQFKVSDYTKQLENEIFVNLNLNKHFYNGYIEKARETPVENDYQYVQKEFLELEIPDGYHVEHIPASTRYEGDVMSFDLNYRIIGNRVILDKSITIRYLLLQPRQFNNWNEAVKKLSEAYRESVIFKTDR